MRVWEIQTSALERGLKHEVRDSKIDPVRQQPHEQRLDCQLQRWQHQQQQPQQQQLCPASPPALPIQPSRFDRNAGNIHIRKIMECIS